MIRSCAFCGIFILSLLLLNPFSLAEDGVTHHEILLGQSCALTGPAQALGAGMRAGLLACFSKVNEKKGGIHGRKIRLISLDDGYEPIKAIKNTRKLIEEDKVFLLIGEVGTPTSKAVVPIAEQAKIPFFGAFTGAEFLRHPFKRYLINMRSSYYQEMEALVKYLVDHKGLQKIACFYQNDGYGQAGLEGIRLALQKRSMELVAKGAYVRNTIAVKKGLLKIRRADPQAVVMVGAYKPCATFIKLAKSEKVGLKNTLFCNISFVGTEALRNELGSDGEGCIISQVVHFPWDNEFPIVNEYAKALKKYQPKSKPSFVSLEGYMVGKRFCMAAEATGEDLAREALIDTFSRIKKFDLGGVVLNYGPNDNQGMDDIFLTIIKDKEIQPLNLKTCQTQQNR